MCGFNRPNERSWHGVDGIIYYFIKRKLVIELWVSELGVVHQRSDKVTES